MAAIFCTFAAFGLVLALMRPTDADPWWALAVWATVSGVIACGWALSFMWRLWVLAPTVVFQVAGPPLIGAVVGEPWRFDLRMSLIGGATIALVVLGFILFTSYLSREYARRQRLEAEMDLAQQIHRALAPPIARTTERADVDAVSHPSAEMGGDMIDLVERGGRTDAFLADVSGHGVRAGVLMGMTKSALRTRLLRDAPLETIVRDLNAIIAQVKDEGMFVTLAAVRFENPGEAVCVLAGHPPIFVVRAATGAVETIDNDALPLGVLDDEAFAAQRVACAAGDLFVLYTDGLTEAQRPGGAMLGVEGLRAIVERRAREHTALTDLRDAVLRNVRGDTSSDDDQSIMLLRVR